METFSIFHSSFPRPWSTASTLLQRVEGLGSLVSLRDAQMCVSTRYMDPVGWYGDEFDEGLKLASLISCTTGGPIVVVDPSCKGTHHEADCLYWDDRIGGFECTYERRVGNDFHVKYDRDSEEIRHMSLYVKGPLAELDFSELDLIEFGSRYGSGYL
jgi:hypothetical protein